MTTVVIPSNRYFPTNLYYNPTHSWFTLEEMANPLVQRQQWPENFTIIEYPFEVIVPLSPEETILCEPNAIVFKQCIIYIPFLVSLASTTVVKQQINPNGQQIISEVYSEKGKRR